MLPFLIVISLAICGSLLAVGLFALAESLLRHQWTRQQLFISAILSAILFTGITILLASLNPENTPGLGKTCLLLLGMLSGLAFTLSVAALWLLAGWVERFNKPWLTWPTGILPFLLIAPLGYAFLFVLPEKLLDISGLKAFEYFWRVGFLRMSGSTLIPIFTLSGVLLGTALVMPLLLLISNFVQVCKRVWPSSHKDDLEYKYHHKTGLPSHCRERGMHAWRRLSDEEFLAYLKRHPSNSGRHFTSVEETKAYLAAHLPDNRKRTP